MRALFYMILIFTLALSLGCTSSSEPTVDDDPNGEEEKLRAFKADEGDGVVKVMSRNVYVGMDVDLILDAEDFKQIPLLAQIAYQQMISTNFNERAEAIALEIEKTLPHVVGLQEMSNTFTQSPSDFDPLLGNLEKASDPLYNFSDILMDALEARGLEYTIAATVQNADVELPMLVGFDNMGQPLLDDVRLVDHDMILVRNDVTYSDPIAVVYDSMLIVDPDYGIVIPRGYVKLEVKVGETSFVFANTHLEAANVIPIRMGQAEQLLNDLSTESMPVIIAGDFNSVSPQGQTYQYVLSEGYTDTWVENLLTYNTNGYTYGHDSGLRNPTPDFRIRIDYVFVKADNNPTIGEGFVLGDETRDMTTSGLWPSDHGGLVTKITFPVAAKLASN